MLRDPDTVRKMVYALCVWVMLSAGANLVQRLSGWPWLRSGLLPPGESGMAISTASCFIVVSVCLLFLARLGK